MNTRNKLALFASGNGTNAEAIMAHFRNDPETSVACVLTNNPEAGVIERAARFGVPVEVFDRKTFREATQLIATLQQAGVTHVVLAGFLWLIPEALVRAFPIVNIHPSLLPHFGGKGMYGMHVHEAVKAAGVKETGITIHVVNEQFDDGKILFQATTPVLPSDTPEQIAEKVHALEYKYFPVVIGRWASGEFR